MSRSHKLQITLSEVTLTPKYIVIPRSARPRLPKTVYWHYFAGGTVVSIRVAISQYSTVEVCIDPYYKVTRDDTIHAPTETINATYTL